MTPDIHSQSDRDRVLASQRKRWEYLRHLYDENDKIPSANLQSVNAYEVGKAVGVTDRAEVDRIFRYLKDAGLIRFMSMGPNVAITKAGVDAVEAALAEPERPTTYFAPINVITIAGGLYNSQIQQSSEAATQTQSVPQNIDWSVLREMLPAIRQAIRNSAVSVDDASAIAADMDTVEAQSKSPSPRIHIIRECLIAIRTLLQRAGANDSAASISEWLKEHGGPS